jgi:WD40 repeat protein/serine/threonine protein kinase
MDDPCKQAKSIFLAALEEHAPEEWPAFVEQACVGDVILRAEVEKLLRAQAAIGSFHEAPRSAMLAPSEAPIREQPGTVIGPYKLLEQIGEGGFGIVFMAEQQQPVRRKVALKVIKPGMDTKQVVARFEAERQALALMDHTHIARVLDAGATDSGRPYFVMELVRGIPITAFCDQNQLPVRERLELFLAVCQAVQHAHQKGIIHRDLKPSNVLVTLQDDGTPLVKVIDFGIAKALGQERLTEKTLCTGFAQMLGTPLYMSPEQAQMSEQDADTRTDIYSLGVLLYELLTGTTPLDKDRLKEAGYDEIRRIIREEEPAKPSTRISTLGQAATTVSANRKSEPKRLSQLFRGELDWIVMKALEKDRNRRYETASNFAADVQRYLHDEPVQACPPSAGYRCRKFARRNKAVLATAAALASVVLFTVIGLAASTILIAREKAQTDAANEKLERTLYYQRVARAEREWLGTVLTSVDQLLDDCPARLRGWEWHYVKRLRLQGLSPLRHPTGVFSAVFSPDGRWIASGSGDGKLRVWDAATGHRLAAFQAHEQPIHCVAFSPDGQRLATASFDGTAKVWSFDPQGAPDKHVQLHTLLDHKDKTMVLSVAFSPDGQQLASAGDDKTVHVWEVATGREVFPSLAGHTGRIWGVAYSPDGQCLASASADTTVKIWDTSTGQEKFTFTKHSGQVRCVAFSSDGRLLASSTRQINTRDDCEFKVWDAQTGHEVLTQRENIGVIKAVTFSPHAGSHPRLASCGFDGKVKLWDLATGQEALSLGEGGAVQSVAFSRDGNRLVSASIDGYVRVWNATPLEGGARQEVATLLGHDGGVHGVAFSPDGRHLVSAGADDTVRLWDFQRALRGETHPLIHTWRVPNTERYCAYNVAFSANGKLLTAGGEDGPQGGWLKVWDTTTWNEVRPFFNGCGPVAFSPDGRYFVAAVAQVSMPLPIKVCDAATGREIQTLKGRDWSVHDMAFAPKADPPLLASASSNGTRIWDVRSGAAIKTLDTGWARCVAFSPNGEIVALAAVDRVIQMWDTRSWKKLPYEPSDTPGCIYSLVFHPKESRVLA